MKAIGAIFHFKKHEDVEVKITRNGYFKYNNKNYALEDLKQEFYSNKYKLQSMDYLYD